MQAPQLIKTRFQLGNNSHSDSFSSLNGVSKAQLEHTKEIVKLFETLILNVKKHEDAIDKYVNHCYNVFSHFESILEERKGSVTPYIYELKQNILTKSTNFKNRTQTIFDGVNKVTKGVQKTIKEREYIDCDYVKFSTQKQKLVSNSKINNDDTKKSYEIEQKLSEIKQRVDRLDLVIQTELPTILILFNKIAEHLTTMICCHVHEIYQIMYDSFFETKQQFSIGEIDNISFQNMSHEIQASQSKICKDIESMKLFNQVRNPYHSLSPSSIENATPSQTLSKFGTAMYPFNGQNDQELTFLQGDIVRVLEENESGWWKGVHVVTGKEGIFPFNYFNF